MDKAILDYMRYGIYKGTIYFPHNKQTIKEYIKELEPLKKTLMSLNKSDVLISLKNEKPNIFVFSTVVSSIGFTDEIYNLTKNRLSSPLERYIFSLFMKESGFSVKKQMAKLYEEIDLGNYSKECFALFKPSLRTKSAYAKKDKIVKNIKRTIETGKVTDDLKKELLKENIHFEFLKVHLSYRLPVKDKDQIVRSYMDRYGVCDVLPHLEEWYAEGLSEELESYIKTKIEGINTPSEIFRLMLVEKDLRNNSLKALLLEHFSEVDLFQREIPLNINVSPGHKHKTKLGSGENYDYLYLYALSSAILKKSLRAEVLLEGEPIMTIDNIFKNVNGSSASLKHEMVIDTRKINILFSGIIQDDFDIMWDVAADKNIQFSDIGPLMIFGSNRYVLEALIKYLSDGKVVKANGKIS